MNKIFYFSLFLLLVFQGCSSKQYFEPKDTEFSTMTVHDINSTIIDFNSVGATLKDGRFISQKGISKISLEKGYKFLNQNDNITLSSDDNGSLSVYENGKFTTIQFDKNIISATIKDNLIAFSYTDNTINLYDTVSKKVVFKEYVKLSLINDIKITNPIFLTSVILYPTLDGKIIIVDKNKRNIVKTINIDPKNDIHNIIFFQSIKDSLVAATPKKLFSFINGNVKTVDLDIKNVIIDSSYIYVSTLDGQLIKYDQKLVKIASKKFKFAKFHTIALGENLYALESQDYLIRLSTDLKKAKIFAFYFDEDEKVITIGNKIYFEDSYITLD